MKIIFSQRRRHVFVASIALLLTMLATAGSIPRSVAAQQATQTVEAPPQTAGETGKVLAWVGNGRSASSRPSGLSELGYLDARGTWQKLLDLPRSFVGVYACGDRALSPDGRRFTFLIHEARGGKDGGTLYQITDAGVPVQVGEAHALTCAGGDPFQYSPDSQRLAYIDFAYSENRPYVSGTLRVIAAASLDVLGEFPSAASFYLTDRDVFFTQYYTNPRGEVAEVAVMLASPAGVNSTASEVVTLFASSGCRFTSAQIAPVFGKLAVLVGERCAAGSQGRLYTLNRDGGVLQDAGNVTAGGGFFANTRTNWLVPSWDDRHLLFTVPDGSVTNTVSLFSLPLETPTSDRAVKLIDGQVRFPSYSYDNFPMPTTATPRLSPDGRYWAMVEAQSADRALSTLHVIDRAQPTTVFDLIAAPDNISQLFFSPDSRTLYAVVGGVNGAANRLQRWDLQSFSNESATATDEPQGETLPGNTIAEGTFGSMVIYPDGRAAAAVIWQRGTDTRETLYQTFARISLEDGTLIQSLLNTTIEYDPTTGNVVSQRFVYPLAVLNESAAAVTAPEIATPETAPAAP